MKLLSILCALCLLLTACTPSAVDTSTLDSTMPSSSDATAEPTSSAQDETTEDPFEMHIDFKEIYFNTLEEYEDFFAENENIQIAITYEKLQKFGSFEYFIFLSTAVLGDYSYYYYTLRDNLGYEFSLSIKPRLTYEGFNKYDMLEPPADGDLRTLDRPRTGYLHVGNRITYFYVHGKLYYAMWESNGLGFELNLQEDFIMYPETDATLVGKLLNVDTAIEAVEELETSIGTLP